MATIKTYIADPERDYKKLREEYVPSVEAVPETQKVMELK